MLQNLDPKAKATLIGRLFEKHNVTLPRKVQLEYAAMLEGARNWPHLVAERKLEQAAVEETSRPGMTMPPASSADMAGVSRSNRCPVSRPSAAGLEAMKASGRYLVSEGWTHCFVGSKRTALRFVFDRVADKLVRCEAYIGYRWEGCHRDEMADLLQSLNDNDLFEHPEDFDVAVTDEMPNW